MKRRNMRRGSIRRRRRRNERVVVMLVLFGAEGGKIWCEMKTEG